MNTPNSGPEDTEPEPEIEVELEPESEPELDIDQLQEAGRVLTGIAVPVNTLTVIIPLNPEDEKVSIVYIDGQGQAVSLPVARPILDLIWHRLMSMSTST